MPYEPKPSSIAVLVVDDDPGHRFLYETYLAEAGFPARCAASVVDALRACDEGLPCCAVLDVKLPDGSGLDLLQTLRERHGETGLAIVLVSGGDDPDTVISALRLGADDYIRKDDITPQSLERLIRRATERVQLKRALEERTTELEQSVATLDLLRRDLLEAEATRQRLYTSISHDLRSPLGILKMALEELREPVGLDTNGRVSTMEMMERAVERLNHLTRGLADLAAADGGKFEADHRRFDLSALLRQLASDFGRMCRKRVLLVAPPSLELQGNPHAIERLVTNLMDNALRYAHERVDVRVRRQPGEVALVVEDDGEGLDPEVAENLFRGYVQDEARRRSGEGLGIGLTVVKEIAELHSGRIAAENREDAKGARFTVVFPAPCEDAGIP